MTRSGGRWTEPRTRPYDRPRTERRRRAAAGSVRSMREIEARDGVIRLGQLLKVAGLAATGGEAKAMLESGEVRVNDEPEARRGRQLRPGDVVLVGEESVRIA
jgi:ribosome-associated protein